MTAVDQQSTVGGRGVLARFAPLRRTLRTEAGGAGLLLLATAVALLWANLPLGDSYDAFWHTELSLAVGGAELSLDLQHWVNDGLMTIFFFVVGLEVKRELAIGELADRRRAAVPMLAALAGLVVPALVYVAFNLGEVGVGAWGVVISTDTAFLIGVLALLGSACPPQLRIFLLALAIADDVGALTVIAIFYTDELRLVPLLLAATGVGLTFALRWLKVWRGPGYLVLAAASWVGLYASGVHPTLLGVVIALTTPAYAARRDEVDDASRRTRAYLQSPNPQFARAARLSIERSTPPGERLQQLWQPWTSYVIIPLFALANAGVALTGETLRAASTSTITIGIVAGLVIGKLTGIVLGARLAVRLRLGDLAPGLQGLTLAGGAVLSGIGFTISLFIVDLAFEDDRLADQARVGVLVASVVATAAGWTILKLAARRRPGGADNRPVLLDPPVDPERDHVRGGTNGGVDAPMTLVEYGDFECPFCGQATGSVDELRARFGDQLRYVFRHVPLTDVHPHAQLAAEAAEAAAAQGRFWEAYDRLFHAQDRLDTIDLLEHAAALGLDVERFARDLGSGTYARHVQEDVESAEASGVAGTPTFFVNGRRHTGPFDAETLAAALLATARDTGDAGRTAPGAVVPALSPWPSDVRTMHAASLPHVPADTPETPDADGAFPRLSDQQRALLVAAGTREHVVAGEVLFRKGEPGYDFHMIISGAVALIEHDWRTDETMITVHGEGRFLGEIDLLSGVAPSRTAVVVRDGEVVRVGTDTLRALMQSDAVLRDLVLRAFLVRRAATLAMTTDLRVVGRPGSADVARLRSFCDTYGLTIGVVEVEAAEDSRLAEHGLDDDGLPLVVLQSGTALNNPSDEDLVRVLGLG